MNWYYAKNGNQNGPLPTEDMKDRIAMGEISPTDLAWCEGMADWTPVGEIPQLKVDAPTREEVPAPPVPMATEPYRAPVAPAPAVLPAQALPGQVPSQGLAIGSMVCGIVGLLVCCFWPLSGPLSMVAVVLGFVALSRAKSNPAAYGGKGMAKAGLVTGILGLLATLVLLGFAMWMATLTPEEIEEKMKWMPEAQRQELREKMDAERAKQQP